MKLRMRRFRQRLRHWQSRVKAGWRVRWRRLRGWFHVKSILKKNLVNVLRIPHVKISSQCIRYLTVVSYVIYICSISFHLCARIFISSLKHRLRLRSDGQYIVLLLLRSRRRYILFLFEHLCAYLLLFRCKRTTNIQ